MHIDDIRITMRGKGSELREGDIVLGWGVGFDRWKTYTGTVTVQEDDRGGIEFLYVASHDGMGSEDIEEENDYTWTRAADVKHCANCLRIEGECEENCRPYFVGATDPWDHVNLQVGEIPDAFPLTPPTEPTASAVVLVAFHMDATGSHKFPARWSRAQWEQELCRILPLGGRYYHGAYRPGIYELSWWVAEDTRSDGSDCDSAIFVTPGRAHEAWEMLSKAGITPKGNEPNQR